MNNGQLRGLRIDSNKAESLRKGAIAVARVDRHEKAKCLPKTSRVRLAFDPNVPWMLSLKVAGFLG
jgi:hypothetical protein